MNKKATIKFNEESPEPVEIIAEAVIKIAEAFEKIKTSKLSERAILLLIKDNCSPVGRKFSKKDITVAQIKEVLDSVASLKKTYIKHERLG